MSTGLPDGDECCKGNRAGGGVNVDEGGEGGEAGEVVVYYACESVTSRRGRVNGEAETGLVSEWPYELS